MTTVQLGVSASENLLETYFALGQAAPGSTITRESAYRLCTNQSNHPISNFAADLRLDANAASRLSQIAAYKPNFHVYRLPNDQPRHAAELLQQAGFKVGHVLTQLAWTPRADFGGDPTMTLEFAANARHRERIAAFMTEQFFSKQSSSFRRLVIEGTSLACGLQLAAVVDRSRTIGSVMLCETAETLGIYNLCVAAGMRNRGFGKQIVRALKLLSLERGKPLVLQCDTALVSWYRDQLFESVGFVEVYSFPAGSGLDIM